MAEQTDSKVPKIRFKGFAGKWEQKTLGGLGRVAMNKRIFKHQTAETGDVPFFKIGTFGKEPDAFISRMLFKEYKSKFPYPTEGDLLISASGSIGRIVEYCGKDEYFQDSNIVWLQHDGAVVNAFLKQFYSFVRWAGLEGSTIKRLYNKNILETRIVLPDLAEQTQIGRYFRELDRLIGLQQRKHDKLMTLKKAMLQKMFPKPGTTTPEIRFKGFEGEWVRRVLGDHASIKGRLGWKSLKSHEYLTTGPSMIAGKHIHDGLIDWNSVDHIPQWRYEESPEIKLKDGDVIFSKDGSLGNPSIIEGLKTQATINSTMMMVRLSGEFSPRFFYQILKGGEFEDLIRLKVSGSSIPHLFQADMKKFVFKAPTKPEQQKIGIYFRTLDELVSKHAVQLAKLKQLKSACLEKMFV